ncbi:MAG: indolepyruvate oxidoreductase subunit beta [Halanaerobiales bacterium]|nr:indolepyruvate oxidoreductase subunit beta [Halanaerobiales bacterium]
MMCSEDYGKNIIICGLGGQGVVLSSDILSDYFLHQGYDLKVSDIMGLGQRGGSVMTHLRYGDKILSPLIKNGTADLMIAFEKTEVLRWAHLLKPNGIVCCNDYIETPTTVTCGLQEKIDVEEYFKNLQQNLDVKIVPINKLIAKHNLKRQVSNIIMLGYLSHLLSWDGELILEILSKRIKKDYLSMNKLAFDLGKNITNK